MDLISFVETPFPHLALKYDTEFRRNLEKINTHSVQERRTAI